MKSFYVAVTITPSPAEERFAQAARLWYNADMTLTITLDKRSEESLQKISMEQGVEPTNMASRLLQRAIRAAQLKPVYDVESLKAAYAEFADEDIALSEATVAEHA